MIKSIQRDNNLFVIEIVDLITQEDAQLVTPIVNEMLCELKEINALMVITEMKGYTIEGLLAEFNFYFENRYAFKKVALVGDGDFFPQMVKFVKNFIPNEVKCFSPTDLHDAMEWLR